MDILDKVVKFVSHNRYVVGGVLIGGLALGWMGCQSRTAGIIEGDLVTRTQLQVQAITVGRDFTAREAMIQAQVAALNADIAASNERLTLAKAELDRKDAAKAQVVQYIGGALTAAATGQLNLPELLTSGIVLLGGLAGAGSMVDARRKDKVIAELKSSPTA